MKRKPAYEMTLAECEAQLAAVKRDPRCLPQDIEHWQHYIDLNNCGRNVVTANRLADERRSRAQASNAYKDGLTGGNMRAASETRACNCVGPQNGAPACPCMMPEYNRRKAGEMALAILEHQVDKPRVRVKAGSSKAGGVA